MEPFNLILLYPEGESMSVQGGAKQGTKIQIKEPKRYCVVMHNDDYTPMDFVVSALIGVFYKEKDEAVRLMLAVHQGGKAVVGNYPYDIALSKIRIVTELAEMEGYPFRLTLEEA